MVTEVGFSPRVDECRWFDSNLHLLLWAWLPSIKSQFTFTKLYSQRGYMQLTLVPFADKSNASELKLQICDAPLNSIKLVIKKFKY